MPKIDVFDTKRPSSLSTIMILTVLKQVCPGPQAALSAGDLETKLWTFKNAEWTVSARTVKRTLDRIVELHESGDPFDQKINAILEGTFSGKVRCTAGNGHRKYWFEAYPKEKRYW